MERSSPAIAQSDRLRLRAPTHNRMYASHRLRNADCRTTRIKLNEHASHSGLPVPRTRTSEVAIHLAVPVDHARAPVIAVHHLLRNRRAHYSESCTGDVGA
jgi:hypothetical protein